MKNNFIFKILVSFVAICIIFVCYSSQPAHAAIVIRPNDPCEADYQGTTFSGKWVATGKNVICKPLTLPGTVTKNTGEKCYVQRVSRTPLLNAKIKDEIATGDGYRCEYPFP